MKFAGLPSALLATLVTGALITISTPASAHGGVVDRALMIAPYLGTAAAYEPVIAAGGLRRWQPEAAMQQAAGVELTDELRQSRKMDAVGRLANGVMHDMNNLLTAIAGQSELALAQLDESEPARTEVEGMQRTV